MEEKLRRGRLLRELLKQDRLAPLTEAAQLAWLLAYGEGLLDKIQPTKIGAAMAGLFDAVASRKLTLDDPKKNWIAALKDIVGGLSL